MAGVAVVAWLSLAALAASTSAHGTGALRKGDGAPWGHYFSPGFGGYYTVDDFRPEPQPEVHMPALPVAYMALDDQQQALQDPDFGQALQWPDLGQMTQGPDLNQEVRGPDFSQETQGPDLSQVTQGPDLSQVTQGPDLSQVTQGPDLNQVTQGPDLSQETQGPDLSQATQGPDLSQVTQGPDLSQQTEMPYEVVPTTMPDDLQQYTTEPVAVEYPTTPYPTTPYETTENPTTEVPYPTTWRPRVTPGGCRANPAAAGYPHGTQLICTVEVCSSAGGIMEGGVKGGGVKGGGVKRGGVKGGGIKGVKGFGVKGGRVTGLGLHGFGVMGGGFNDGRHVLGLGATLVCRPFVGCDEPVQTTEGLEFTTVYTTGRPWEAETTPAYTTPTPEYTTPEPEYTTPVPTTQPPPPPPTAPPTLPPGVKGGRRQHVAGVKGVKGGVQHGWQPEAWPEEVQGVKGVKGVKGGVQHGWQPEAWPEEVQGVKRVKGRGPSANVPRYSSYNAQWGMDLPWGTKTARKTTRRPTAGVKRGSQSQGDEDSQQRVKGHGRSGQAGYQFGGWGHQDNQGTSQGQETGYYLL